MRSILTSLACFIIGPALGQFGNEWIKYSNSYFKIPVAKDGIYRLGQSDLINAGIPANVDPTTIQIFHRGQEQAVFINGESDNQLNAGDYVEFYGIRNDGTLDTELYVDPAAQPHKYYNLYSDTTAYFLTYGATLGKRMQSIQISSTGLVADNYHVAERLLILKDQYSPGVDYGDIQNSSFDYGEGWMGVQIIQSQSMAYAVEGIDLPVTAAGKPELEMLLVGRGPMSHTVEISAGNRVLGTANFPSFQSYKYSAQLEWSDIVSNQVSISARVVGSPDRISVAYIRIRFPQQVDQTNLTEKFYHPIANLNSNSLLQIKNVPTGTTLYDVTNANTVKKIFSTQTTTFNAVVNSSASKKLFAASAYLVPSIRKVTFRQIDPASANYIIVSHPTLRKPASGYTDPVKAYGEYRSLPQGGGYDTLVLNVTQLYDQFSYGEKTSVAIYRLMKFLSSVRLPSYLFLIGKGLDVGYGYFRSPTSFTTNKDLVPPAGTPGSDMAYTVGLSSETKGPAVATGRLSASGPPDVAAYLNKVKETEARPFNDLRRKDILHLSGGLYAGEPQIFQSYLNYFGKTAKSFYLGGRVKAIAKQTTNQELINVADELNAGLGMITFFGHSSSSSSDFDIGNVTDPVLGYNNKGKYPVFLLNGCLAGSAFLNQSIFGENWTNTPDKGAVGVIAHSNLAFAHALRNYSDLFYQVAFGDASYINKGVGDVQREVARRYMNVYGVSELSAAQTQQMVLLGDPAIRIFGAAKPDFSIRAESVTVSSTTGETLTALSDSLKIRFVAANFGIAANQPLKVTIKRTTADGRLLTYDSLLTPLLYSDTIEMRIAGKTANAPGNNMFEIIIDSDNGVDELREDNNSFSTSLFIPLNRTRNLFPTNYSIVNSNNLSLTFQHTDLLADETDFIIELDTTRTFTSDYAKNHQIEIKAKSLATVNVTLLDRDSTVYFWRTRLLNPGAEESNGWELSSFVYIKNGPTGWAQLGYPQYEDNLLIDLVQDPPLRDLKFLETKTDIAVKTFGAGLNKPADSTSFKIKGVEYNINVDPSTGFVCRNNTINLIAFDRKTTMPYPGIYFTWQDLLYNYGSRRLLCGREPYVINSFTPSELVYDNKGDIIRYVDNISEGDSVILFNIGDPGYSAWPAAAKAKLGLLGIASAQIEALSAGEPVVIFAKKGAAPGAARIARTTASPPDQQRLKVNSSVTGRATGGFMKSVRIGPALRWKQFIVKASHMSISDKVFYDIVGISAQGANVTLKTNITSSTDISDIDAKSYPELTVVLKVEDDILLTPAHLDYWLVTFDVLPEGILLFDDIRNVTLHEGQAYKSKFRFVNFSNGFFSDSLIVQHSIRGTAGDVHPYELRIKSPLPADTTKFALFTPTGGLDGTYDHVVSVNPRRSPELIYDNNTIELKGQLAVLPDKSSPVLDVTIDGRHLQNDDYVSPSPTIALTLWDDNPYLIRKDTVGINIFLSDDCDDLGCVFKRINFSRADVEWRPETEASEFTATFRPHDLSDGTYRLRVVAADVHGNPSGSDPYEISFNVIHETSVEILPVYPNPAYDRVNFDVEIRGVQLPNSAKLSIIDIAGKTYSDIDIPTEPLHVGTNIISMRLFDASGYPVPNGIYVYTLTVSMENRSTERRGKLVVVR